MRAKQKLALLILCISVVRLRADVGLLPGSEPLRQMFDDATLVCRCSVLSVRVLREEKIPGDPHGNTFNVMKALLKEEKLYKADHKGYQTITLIYQEYPFSQDVALERVESDRLFFLKKTEGDYGFVAPRYYFQMPRGSTAEGTGITQLEADLIAGLESNDRSSLLSTLRLLQALDKLSLNSLSVLKHFLAGKDPEIALAVHAVLIKTGDPDEVARFAAFEEKNRSGNFMKFISIGAALNRVRSTQALPALMQLADSPLIPIKQGALESIRAIKNKKSIPTLIKHLDDTDSMSRYIADISLSEILNMNYPPYLGLFEKDEGKYISVWKTWWEAEGRAIYEPQAKIQPR